MKTTREVFMIMRARKIDKRDHEIAKKTQFCQFVNNTLYGFPTYILLLFIYLLNFAHTYTYIFLLLKSRLIKIRARDLLETIKGF